MHIRISRAMPTSGIMKVLKQYVKFVYLYRLQNETVRTEFHMNNTQACSPVAPENYILTSPSLHILGSASFDIETWPCPWYMVEWSPFVHITVTVLLHHSSTYQFRNHTFCIIVSVHTFSICIRQEQDSVQFKKCLKLF